MKRFIQSLGLEQLPSDSIIIGDDLALVNFNNNWPAYATPEPYKLQHAAICICTAGSCSIKVNLQHYDVESPMLVTLMPGQIVEGIDYYDIEDEFVHSRITSKKAIDMLKNYGNLLTYKAEEKIQKWQMEIDTGIKYSDINDAYYIGDITAAQYVDYQVKYGGVEDYEKAAAVYDAHGKASGYAKEDFCRDMIEVKGVSAIKDDEGNTITKQQIMRWNYIDSLKLSRAQKDMLHLIFYAESSLKNTPWNSRK